MSTSSSSIPQVELRIRGKRSRKGVPNKAGGIAAPRGRPMKPASKLATTRRMDRVRSIETQKHHLNNMATSRNVLSQLEALPIELIQVIFLSSLEVNLPRASPSLAKSLSKESIYRALILFAFFDDDGKHPVDTKSFALAQYRRLDLAEKLRLQTSILNCRWCTLFRLQRTMPTLSRLAMVQAWHEEWRRQLYGDESEPDASPITPSPVLREVAKLPGLGDVEAVQQHFLAKSSEWAAESEVSTPIDAAYLPRIRTWSSSRDAEGHTYKTVDGARGVLNARYIPDRLLQGRPWSPQAIQYLKFIRQGWRFLQNDFVLKISSTAMFGGMESAIAEHNVEALRVLLELHYAAFQDQDSNTSVTAAGRVRYTVSFSHPLPAKLFHQATQQGGKSAEIISLLLREGIDSVPRDDVVITKWAIREADSGEKVAVWLLKHMEGTQDYGLGRGGSSLFVNGNMTWRRTEGEYPFPEISFTDELAYLKDGAIDFRLQILDG